jgi:polysaccharide chain length determinant protein (PEP-CTERM system associated)
MQEQLSDIFISIKGTLKNKRFAINLAWIICLLGWLVIFLLPNKYTSTATVHIDSTTMLQPLLKDIAIQQDSKALVRVMKKLMFTVPNLDKIIYLTNLDSLVENDIQRLELYEDMKKDILIKGGKKDGLFEVSYESNDPKMAKDVVSAVLTVFSEQTQLSTMEDMNNSQKFIDKQIKEYEIRLRNAEEAREVFKRKNIGLLPEEGQGQITRLHVTRDRLDEAKLELSKSISKKNILTKQMQDVVNKGNNWSTSNSEVLLSPQDQKLMDLRLEKTNLLLKYTENHPRVRAIESSIEKVLKDKTQNNKESVKSGLPNAGAMANPYVQQLKIALNDAETAVASHYVRVNYLKQRIKNYNEKLNLRLTVETKMKNLNRDYAITNENFQKLVQRREQARMSEKVDSETVSIKFKIADPPNEPLSPSGPKRLLLYSGILFLGIGSGFGLAYLFYYLRPTYMTSRQLQEATGLPILGNVSMQGTSDSNNNNKSFLFIPLLAGLILVYLSLMIFEYLRLSGIGS